MVSSFSFWAAPATWSAVTASTALISSPSSPAAAWNSTPVNRSSSICPWLSCRPRRLPVTVRMAAVSSSWVKSPRRIASSWSKIASCARSNWANSTPEDTTISPFTLSSMDEA